VSRYSDISFLVVLARRDVMDHCYNCEGLDGLIWLMCFYNHFNRGFFHKLEIEHKEEKQRTYSNIFFKIRLYLRMRSIRSIPLIIKRPKDHELLPWTLYANEQTFYNTIVPHLEDEADLFPRCYRREESWLYKINSFIIMEDLAARGYKVTNKKLDRRYLIYCIESLARFHQRMLQLKKDEHWPYEIFMDTINQSQPNRTRMIRLKKVR